MLLPLKSGDRAPEIRCHHPGVGVRKEQDLSESGFSQEHMPILSVRQGIRSSLKRNQEGGVNNAIICHHDLPWIEAASFAINAGVFGVKGNEKQGETVTGEWHWKVTLVVRMFFLLCSLNCSQFVSLVFEADYHIFTSFLHT